jgi:hypothetical protein
MAIGFSKQIHKASVLGPLQGFYLFEDDQISKTFFAGRPTVSTSNFWINVKEIIYNRCRGLLKVTSKTVALTIFVLLASTVLQAQTVSEFITKIREKEDVYLEDDALTIAKQAVARYPSSKELLCKCSILCSKVGQRQTDKAQRKAYFSLAQYTAKAALKLNPNDAICNLVMSIAMGRMALVSGLNDKIEYSRDIHKYSLKATQLDANLAPAWHVVGKYNLVISELSSFEKKSVQLLMGGLPAGDLPNAISCFEKC